MQYAIFTRRRGKQPRAMHAVRAGNETATATVCGLPIGVGTGLVRDGDYAGNVPCAKCWER